MDITTANKSNLEWAQQHFQETRAKYKRYDNYYDGIHVTRISDKIREAFSQLLGDMKDNLCPLVCDSLSDRLTLEGFASSDEALSVWCNELWEDLCMESRSDDVHRDAVTLGDAYVIVWADQNDPTGRTPRIYPQDTENIAVRYEDNGQEDVIVEAVKAWVTGDMLRVTRYLPDRIERYYQDETSCEWLPTDTSALKPYELDGDSAFPHNLGRVPVFRFSNSRKLRKYAMSEIRDVVPIQDILNKTIIDLVVGGEFHSLPQRWATGLTIPIDPETGKERKPFESGLDRIWAVGDKDVAFGQFTSADLSQIVEVINDHRHEIARVSRTPLHLMMLNTGDFPSGEALRTAEAPLIAKAKKRISVWGEVWEQIVEMCALIAGVNLTAKVDAHWADPSPMSENEQLSILNSKKSIGVSQPQLLKEAGYSDEDIQKMQEDNDEQATKTAERAAKTFNAGKVF